MTNHSQGTPLPTFEGHLSQTSGSAARRTHESHGAGVRFQLDPFLAEQVNGSWAPHDLRDLRQDLDEALSIYQKMGSKIKEMSSAVEELVRKATTAKIGVTSLNALVMPSKNKLGLQVTGMVFIMTADSKGESEDQKAIEKWLVGTLGEHSAQHWITPYKQGSSDKGAMWEVFTSCSHTILSR